MSDLTMSKYKININQPLPDDTTINSKKDFGKVYRDYNKIHQPWWVLRNFHKNKQIRRILIYLFILLLTLYFTSHYFKKEEEKVKKEKLEQRQLNSQSHLLGFSPTNRL